MTQFKYLQKASSQYLTEQFPDEWKNSNYTEENVDKFIKEHMTAAYEGTSISKMWQRIEASADQLQAVEDSQNPENQWTKEPPTKTDEYWHWNGNPDASPTHLYVSLSGTSNKAFVMRGQLGIPHAIDCDKYGGWWIPCDIPTVPQI
jgi:hypothetical protein